VSLIYTQFRHIRIKNSCGGVKKSQDEDNKKIRHFQRIFGCQGDSNPCFGLERRVGPLRGMGEAGDFTMLTQPSQRMPSGSYSNSAVL
jgi:hypothetical protein